MMDEPLESVYFILSHDPIEVQQFLYIGRGMYVSQLKQTGPPARLGYLPTGLKFLRHRYFSMAVKMEEQGVTPMPAPIIMHVA